jgi:tripartite-type tricarboxylate transporter receptor subunit TctC
MKRSQWIVTSLIAGMLGSAGATAWGGESPAYPRKPVRMIVPFPPGGNTDFLARTIGQKLTESWGQQVIVDNRPGAGGSIAGSLAAHAPADGYTILFVSTTHAVAMTLHERLQYNLLRDFAPVVLMATAPQVLAAHPNVPAKNVQQLVAYARAHPGKLSYASSGVGGGAHLTAELFKMATGTNIVHVPYKGNASALTDLMGGQIELMFAGIISVVAPMKSGRVRVIAVTSAQRSPVAPGVPTMAESGVAIEANSWYGLAVPAATPREIVYRLNADVTRVLNAPEIGERLGAEGAIVAGGSAEQFGTHLRREVEKWAEVIRKAQIKVQ